MKLSEVRAFIDALELDVSTACRAGTLSSRASVRSALAEAFEAGVRSPGLRFQKTAALRKACGCEE